MIEIPNGISANMDDHTLILKKGNNSVEREFPFKRVNIKIEDKKLLIRANKGTKRELKIIGTVNAHIKNMIKGLGEGHTYKLKICSGHFPMNVSVGKDEFTVKNFLGEKMPRTLKLKENVEVTIEGDIVEVTSINKELAGQTAANIERLCKITNRDPRVFQDGIWIIDKDGKIV